MTLPGDRPMLSSIRNTFMHFTLQTLPSVVRYLINAIEFCIHIFPIALKESTCLAFNKKFNILYTIPSVLFQRIIIIAGFNTDNTVEDTGGHAQRIFALRFLPGSSDLFITGGWDNNLRVSPHFHTHPPTFKF